jgi:hypothetical protein
MFPLIDHLALSLMGGALGRGQVRPHQVFVDLDQLRRDG